MPSMILKPVDVINDPQYGSVPWTNPGGFKVKYYGESRAELNPGQSTNYATAFFDCSVLPENIVGILVKVQANLRLCEAYCKDASVRLGQLGVPMGDDKANPTLQWQLSQHYRIYGSPTDLWNLPTTTIESIRENGLNLFFAGRWDIGPGDGRGLAKIRGDDIIAEFFY